MTSPSSGGKRKHSAGLPLSPPPLRRKVQSTTTQNAVASFFTPTSQKPPEKIVWQERARSDDIPSTLLVGKYDPSDISSTTRAPEKRRKIAAFDFDSTLIQTSSGKKFASDSQDWKWWHPTVPGTLRKLYLEDGFRIVVISNQGGISLHPDTKAPKAHLTKLGAFKAKVSAVFNQLDLPTTVYAATEKDTYRKPRTGMWKELLEDFDIHLPGDLNLKESIFVGDAGGRTASGGKPRDFSCSDRNFADNIGVKFYSPEEFFLHEAPRPFERTFEPANYLTDAAEVSESYMKKNDQDIVLFVGSPGAGKSTFYWKQLKPLGYERVNQDILKSRDKCIKVAAEYLDKGKSVAVDNTNADSEVRSKWVDVARRYSIPIRCVLFSAEPRVCEHNDVVRALNIVDITQVAFKFVGTEVEREIWTRYWT